MATPGRPLALNSGTSEIMYNSKCGMYFNLSERSKYHYVTLTLHYMSLINVSEVNKNVKTK